MAKSIAGQGFLPAGLAACTVWPGI